MSPSASRPGGIVVMKFGGTSVADPAKIQRAADRAIAMHRKGFQVAVVVSAPGNMTDELIDLAEQITPQPHSRELDMLMATGEQVAIALFAIACRARKVPAVSLTGGQAGIRADANHTKARIVGIEPKKVLEKLKEGLIVAVAGFQGLTPEADIATLGRGGSDLTAVALAAAVKARYCDIYSDVDGIYTADPRLEPRARLLKKISYDEMLELAGAGAQVMQGRSIEVAKKYGVPVRVSSAFKAGGPGTWIKKEGNGMEEALVTAVALDPDRLIVTLRDVSDRPGVAAEIFTDLEQAGVKAGLIVQSAAKGGLNDISFTISAGEWKAAQKALARHRRGFRIGGVEKSALVSTVSAVGVGMRGHSAAAAAMFGALAHAKINIQMISTSEIKVSCVVDKKDGARAVRCLHEAFSLQKRS